MKGSELIEYLENKHMEIHILNILMFNDVGYSFIPVSAPRVDRVKQTDSFSILGADEINLLCSDYQIPSFKFDESMALRGWNRYLLHPEHLHAYIIRYGNDVAGEIFYDRSEGGIRRVRNAAFEDYLENFHVETIEGFWHHFNRSVKNMEKYRKGMAREKSIYDVDLLFDGKVKNSIQIAGEDFNTIRDMYMIRLLKAENEIFKNRYISVNNALWLMGENNLTSLVFQAEFVPLPPLRTPLDKDITIIDKSDKLSDILYQIAIDTDADVFYAATGYAYESGLQMLLPAITCVRGNNKPHRIEMIIGDLYKYAEGVKQKGLNRMTAMKLNWYKDSYMLDHLYTYPSAFYHGKFYYISNGDVSYVITGSSNMTETAYTKNRELDVLFRFHKDEEMNETFLAWYSNLKSQCIELPRLDENLFASNLNLDESGTTSGGGLYKRLTSDEEKKRYKYLESFHPDKIDEDIFSKKKEFKAFKNYVAFIYANVGLTIIEGFSYGNSCYVMGTADEELIRHEFARKSKEQVRKSDFYISHIKHDSGYEEELSKIFKVYVN